MKKLISAKRFVLITALPLLLTGCDSEGYYDYYDNETIDWFLQLTSESYAVAEVAHGYEGTDGGAFFIKGDDRSADYTLPWDFDFYGVTVTEVRVDTNGHLWMGTGKKKTRSYNIKLPSYPVIAGYNGDIDSKTWGDGVSIEEKTNPERVVFMWNTSHNDDDQEGKILQYEIVLYKDGDIRFNYDTNTISRETCDDRSSGVSSGNGWDYTQLTYNIYDPGEEGKLGTTTACELSGRSFLFRAIQVGVAP